MFYLTDSISGFSLLSSQILYTIVFDLMTQKTQKNVYSKKKKELKISKKRKKSVFSGT